MTKDEYLALPVKPDGADMYRINTKEQIDEMEAAHGDNYIVYLAVYKSRGPTPCFMCGCTPAQPTKYLAIEMIKFE